MPEFTSPTGAEPPQEVSSAPTTAKPPLRLRPVIRATSAVVAAVAVFGLLLGLAEITGQTKAVEAPYAVWATAVTVSVLAWASVFVAGLARMRELAPPWKPSRRWLAGAILLYAVLAIAASGLLLLLTGEMGMSHGTVATILIVRILMVLGWTAAGPWLLLVWITDQRVRALRSQLSALRPGSGVLAPTLELDEIWTVIERASLALGLMLSTLVIDTALMRNILIANGASGKSLPAWSIIGYGVFFMIVLAAILVPVLVGWRDTGFAIVRVAIPDTPSGMPTEDAASGRERLLERLGVEKAFIRRPIAALAVLAPFLTAFFTSLVPTS